MTVRTWQPDISCGGLQEHSLGSGIPERYGDSRARARDGPRFMLRGSSRIDDLPPDIRTGFATTAVWKIMSGDRPQLASHSPELSRGPGVEDDLPAFNLSAFRTGP